MKPIENDPKFLQEALARAVIEVTPQSANQGEYLKEAFREAASVMDRIQGEYHREAAKPSDEPKHSMTDLLLRDLQDRIFTLEVQQDMVLAAGSLVGKSAREMSAVLPVSAPTIGKRIRDENIEMLKAPYAKALRAYADNIERER